LAEYFTWSVVLGDECKEELWDSWCYYYKEEGDCTNLTYMDWMINNCATTCGYCVKDMSLLQPWTYGEASDCSNLGCSFVGSLTECLENCSNDPDCTLANFCPDGGDCTSGMNRCCLRKCTDDDHKLTTEWKGWEIYIKDEFYEKSMGSNCHPYVGDMQSTNELDAKIECTRNPSCTMFYQLATDETVFRSCENTAEIYGSGIGSILYQKTEKNVPW